MGSVIFCTIVMVAVLGIVYRALGAVGADRLQIPIVLSMGAIVLLSTSMYLSPVPANTLRVIIGLSLLAWMLYVFIVSQIEPKRKSAINLTDDQKKIRDLVKEVMSQTGSDFDVDNGEGKDPKFEEVKPDKKPGKPSGLTPEDMMPMAAGTQVSTPEGDGVIDVYIPTLEMVYKTEDYRDVRGYRVRMDDNNIRYFRMSDVRQK
jgi:hypothetical protein